MRYIISFLVLAPFLLNAQQGMLLHTGVSLTPNYVTEYQDVLDYATSETITLPSANNQGCQNAVIDTFVTHNILDSLELLYFFEGSGNEDFAKINFKDPGNFTASVGGTLSYTDADGYSRIDDDAADYVTTGFIPNTDCVNCNPKSVIIGGLFNLATPPDGGGLRRVMGSSIASAGTWAMLQFSGASESFTINMHGIASGVSRTMGTKGVLVLYRYGSGVTEYGDQQDLTDTDRSGTFVNTSMSTQPIAILNGNFNGSYGTSYSGFKCSVFLFGAYPGSKDKLDIITNTLEAYEDCID